MLKNSKFLIGLLIFFWGSFAFSANAKDMSWKRNPEKGLTEEYANFRAKHISDVNYDLEFSLSEQEEIFFGNVVIDFNLKEVSHPLTIDFSRGNVVSLVINGKTTPIHYNSFFIELPQSFLKEGKNQVRVEFNHPYSHVGSGLYRFRDPEDKKVYVYTDFEPYDANLLFPSFDQPNLKAKFTLKVHAPKNWTVVTYSSESKVTEESGEKQLWEFPQSLSFSTYVFSLHAGPYHIWKGKSDSIPLRLMARESISKYVNAEEWLKTTDQGLKFYANEFGVAYPFFKYDQVIVPDFNAGAMENVAAVTFSERYIRRGTPTLQERERQAAVILHEMAHMWFGDLVTMRWWNDLWLNESFATYMGTLALAEATPFKTAWQSFFSGMKQWAYFEDQLVTTHPILAEVPSTEHAFSNFDGITYGKGASVLKQLSYLIGRESFKKGVSNYFQKHAFQNATLKDFMGALSETSKADLSKWNHEWLQTEGVNSVSAEVRCQNGKISEFHLKQSNLPQSQSLRSHKTEIGLFQGSSHGTVDLIDSISIPYQSHLTRIDKLKGKKCPDFIYPNLNDYDYVQVVLDGKSIAFAKKYLSKIDDDFIRMTVWQSMWDMVRNTQLSMHDYVSLIIKHLGGEKNPKILNSVLSSLSSRRSLSLVQLLPQESKDEIQKRKQTLESFETLTWNGVESSAAGSDLQKDWFDAYIRIASSQAAQNKLLQLLGGRGVPNKLEVDQERRWEIIEQLSSLNAPEIEKIIEAELSRDNSSFGKQAALSARAAKPDLKNKQAWFNRLVEKKSGLTLAEKRAIGGSLFPANQQNLRHLLSEKYSSAILEMAKNSENEFLSYFSRQLVPLDCTPIQNNKMESFVKRNNSLPPIVIKNLKGALQEDSRCLNIRDVY